MGYQLRMHSQVRDWLTELRDCEPEVARLVGEAVLAMLEAGENLGPPLIVPLESVLRPPDDPREALAEVEIGATALIVRTRAHTLAQARQRLGLTQAQVAARMNVRLKRVVAIERGGSGATEVRTLAAYVKALGGRLEIVADISGERIRMR